MGLDLTALRFLIDARSSGTSFASTITLGRQTLFVEPDALSTLDILGRRLTMAESTALLAEAEGFADPFLRLLGAEEIRATDVSAYQGATIIHDMNAPIPQSLQQSCTVLVDSGTLEHIFNFPQAMKNCMEMVRVGGHFLGLTPANNFMGHGFYQFSPELFFRVLSREHGFEIERMLIYEEYAAAPRFFEVPDPQTLGRRVGLINRYPTYLLVRARRVAEKPIFAAPPQQSDYAPMWNQASAGALYQDRARSQYQSAGARRIVRQAWRTLKPLVPARALEWLRARRRGPDAFDPHVYNRVSL